MNSFIKRCTDNTLQYMKMNKDKVIVTHADKGNVTVIMDKEEYQTKYVINPQ